LESRRRGISKAKQAVTEWAEGRAIRCGRVHERPEPGEPTRRAWLASDRLPDPQDRGDADSYQRLYGRPRLPRDAHRHHELERVVELPVHHYSLQVRLPRIWPPELERLRAGVSNHTDDIADAVQAAAATSDGPRLRLSLLQAASELCQHDEIDLESLAIIIVDLARPISLFVCASLIAATAVSLGRCPTPTGLLVAAS
jgi:hypothetical protein